MSLWGEVLLLLLLPAIVVGLRIVFDRHDPLRTKPLRERRREFWTMYAIVLAVGVAALLIRGL